MYDYQKTPTYGKILQKIALLKIGTYFAVYGKKPYDFQNFKNVWFFAVCGGNLKIAFEKS